MPTDLAARVIGLVPDPFDIEVLCKRIAQHRGRPIKLVPFSSGEQSSPSGMWVAAAEVDTIFYPVGTTPFHRDHIILHEIGHMIGEHVSTDLLDLAITCSLLPDLGTAAFQLMMRGGYDDEQEREAEEFAHALGAVARRKQSEDPVIDRALRAYSG